MLPNADPGRYAGFRERSRINVGKSHLQQLDFYPGAELLLTSSSAEGTARVYERSSKRLLSNVPLVDASDYDGTGLLAWPELDSDGAPLFVEATHEGLRLATARRGQTLAVFGARPVNALRWSPDRTVLVAVSSDISAQTSIAYFFRRTGLRLELLREIAFSERVDGWDLSRDNRLLALTHYPSNDVRVIDLAKGIELFRMPGQPYAGDVSLSPDGRFLAVGGEGLLVIDLLNPKRRAFYSYLYNNIGTVRFSPSGDAIVASAFDGRIRIFELRERSGDTLLPATPVRRLELSLLATLRHERNANVYNVAFDLDGNGLTSVSGDQTIRWFRGARAAAPARATGQLRQFHTLEQWQMLDPLAAKPWPEVPAAQTREGRYVPPALSLPPRPSRLRSGQYACKVSAEYRLRDCEVDRDESGHTRLRFGSGHLLDLAGLVYDDGERVRFEGWLTQPSQIVGCPGCAQWPLYGVLSRHGSSWKGVLTFRNYFDPYAPPVPPAGDATIEDALDRFVFEVRFGAP